MPNISLADASVYQNNANKPTDGDKLKADLLTIINECNAKEVRLTNIESNAMTFAGQKGFSNGILADSIDNYTTNYGAQVDKVLAKAGLLRLGNVRATVSSVDTVNDILTTDTHGFTTADPAKVRLGRDGVIPTGLALTTTYYVRAVTATSLSLHPTAADASANTNKIDITATGSGTIWVVGDPTSNSDGDLWYGPQGFKYRHLGQTINMNPHGDLLSVTQIAAGTTAITFTTILNSTLYDSYILEGINIVPTTNSVFPNINLSTDGGATWLAGATSYGHSVLDHGSASAIYSTSTNAWLLTNQAIVNTAGIGISFSAFITNVSSSNEPMIKCNSVSLSGALIGTEMAGNYGANILFNGIRLIFTSSSTIASGTIKLYGLRKSL